MVNYRAVCFQTAYFFYRPLKYLILCETVQIFSLIRMEFLIVTLLL